MTLRVDFIGGSWRIIECDEWRIEGQLTKFFNDGNIVLTTTTNNMIAVEPVAKLQPVPSDAQRGS